MRIKSQFLTLKQLEIETCNMSAVFRIKRVSSSNNEKKNPEPYLKNKVDHDCLRTKRPIINGIKMNNSFNVIGANII